MLMPHGVIFALLREPYYSAVYFLQFALMSQQEASFQNNLRIHIKGASTGPISVFY